MAALADTAFYTAWLLLHDRAFIRQHQEVRAEAVYPRGSLRYLVGLSLRHWREHHKLLTPTALAVAAEAEATRLRRAGAEAEQVQEVYVDLSEGYPVEEEALPLTRQLGHKWLERRLMLAAIEKAGQALDQGDTGAARAHLNLVSLPGMGERTSALRLSLNADEVLKRRKKSRKGALPTGFYELDRAWSGGVHKGELGMVLAPTGIGKTMCLAYFAAQAVWANLDVLFYTFELTPQQVMERMLCAILEKGAQAIKQPWQDELQAAAERRGVLVPAADIDVRGDTLTWPELVADLDAYREERGKYPDLLLLDSADDIAPLRQRDSQWLQLLEAFAFLRAQAQEKGLRVWTSGQLAKEAVDKGRVSLRQIGHAFAKAQKSHYVLGFAQTPQDLEFDEGPQIHLYVLKDTIHGTRGAALRCTAEFGRGENGYPGFEVESVKGLPVDLTMPDRVA